MKFQFVLTALSALTTVSSAFAWAPDVTCDGGTFSIERSSSPRNADFTMKFTGKLTTAFESKNIINVSTISTASRERVQYESEDSVSLNLGSTTFGRTPISADIMTVNDFGDQRYLIELIRDASSSGYYLYVVKMNSDESKMATQYYFDRCTFGPGFSQ